MTRPRDWSRLSATLTMTHLPKLEIAGRAEMGASPRPRPSNHIRLPGKDTPNRRPVERKPSPNPVPKAARRFGHRRGRPHQSFLAWKGTTCVRSMETHHATSDYVLRHSRVLTRPRCGASEEPSGPNHRRYGNPSFAKAGDRHSVDCGRQAVPVAGGRIGQQHPHQPRVHEAGVAHAYQDQAQQRPGGRFLGPHRTAGRQVRLQCAGRCDSGRQGQQPAPCALVVRKLEERRVHLRARLGEARLQAVPAHTARRGSERRSAHPFQRCEPGRRCARFCGPDAAHQGCRRQAAHGRHDPGGERNRNLRPLARGPAGLRGASAGGTDGLPSAAQRHLGSGASPGVGGGRLQDIRDLGGSVRRERRRG